MSRLTKITIALIILSVLFLIRPRDIFPNELSSQYQILIEDLCYYHDVPVAIALAIAHVESNVEMKISKPNWNGTHDIGIFQLNSRYVCYFEERLWENPWQFNPHEVFDNIEMGILILKDLAMRTGNWNDAIKAYHVGPTKLINDPSSADDYFNKVLDILTELDA